MSNKIAFLGGDMRQHIAAVSFVEKSWDVYEWGQSGSCNKDGITASDDIYSAILNSHVVVLPLPATVDGTNLNCNEHVNSSAVKLTDIVDNIESNSLLLGGKIPEYLCEYAEIRNIKCVDYFKSETFQIKNAYTTAEAALFVAMEKLNKNIRGSKFAITGYGRIAKQLAILLMSLGGYVTVCARRDSDLTWAELCGADTIHIGPDLKLSLSTVTHGYDVVFNTVPSVIFDFDFLAHMDKNTLIIELASSPGGIDVSAAKQLHSNVLWAASLPGKYAPISAGELIAECISTLLEREVLA